MTGLEAKPAVDACADKLLRLRLSVGPAPTSGGSGRADHRPFAPNLVETTRQKLPEAPDLLELSEYRLNHLLPEAAVAAVAAVASPLHPGGANSCSEDGSVRP